MALRIFNTFSREKETFEPIHSPKVRMYTCGPTVYDYPHLGNFRTYVFEDVLRRWLKFSGYQVTQVMNLTDIDDKTIRGAREKGISLRDYTSQYSKIFFEDAESLNIEKAEHYPRATDHIPAMVRIIQDLLAKGIAYCGEDGSIYYNVRKFPDYGKLAHMNLQDLKTGVRIQLDEYDKEQAADFALWKIWNPQDGEVFWETEIGKGRPGWHIECSAMSMEYLGPQLDIHAGGVDNIFPHHQNEAAQSEAYTGTRFAKYWVHAEHLIVEGKKMSKSLGNFYTVREILNQGNSGRALRYFYASSHYRNKINFTSQSLQAAESAVERIRNFLARLKEAEGEKAQNFPELLQRAKEEFRTAMNDDLNTPQAVAALHEFITCANFELENGKISNQQGKQGIEMFFEADRILGLNLKELLEEGEELPPEIRKLAEERERARIAKDFSQADALRKQLQAKGFQIDDTPAGPRVKRLS